MKNDKEMYLKNGRFGPYIQYELDKEKKKIIQS